MAGLVARIEEMNTLAELSEGFVWRQAGTEVTADALLAFRVYHTRFEVDRVFSNMSI